MCKEFSLPWGGRVFALSLRGLIPRALRFLPAGMSCLLEVLVTGQSSGVIYDRAFRMDPGTSEAKPPGGAETKDQSSGQDVAKPQGGLWTLKAVIRLAAVWSVVTRGNWEIVTRPRTPQGGAWELARGPTQTFLSPLWVLICVLLL